MPQAKVYGQIVEIAHAGDARAITFGQVVETAWTYSEVASVSDIAGAPSVAATFSGASSSGAIFRWEWVSVPGGSTLSNAATPFPDSKAITPIDMTGNVGLWHFEGNANDTSGEGNNGTVTNAVQSTGKVGSNAYVFDGDDDYIEVANDSSIQTLSALTISAWVKPTNVGDTYQRVVDKSTGNNGAGGYSLWVKSTNGLIGFALSGSSADNLYSSTALSASTWYHIVASTDGSTKRIYINGVEDASDAGAGATPSSSTANLRIGGSAGVASREFAGDIDEVAIWNRALRADEIQQIYYLQNGSYAGAGTTNFTFTPDVVGTYQIRLHTEAPGASAVNDTADAVIAASGPANLASLAGVAKADIDSIIGVSLSSITKVIDVD